MARSLATSALTLAALALPATAAAQDRLTFVACPIVRDTSSVPCWLSEYGGELYYLGIQTDVSAEFNPPWLGHLALVEGAPKAGERICGGLVLDDVRVSVMPELSPECNTVLMAEERYELGFEPPRPPGPSGGRLAFAPVGSPVPPPPPEPPFVARTFDVHFPFETSVNFKTPNALGAVLDYASAIGASRIEVTGHRAAVRLSDGTVLEEQPGLAARRAREIAGMFNGLIPTVERIETVVDESAEPGDWRDRKVAITVYP
ncbi:hypothetical protein M3P36_01350 [Altererythrobacter sp. KTW20L]|uniref:hypothetical protein n=1 Tax=Altererythrobacter sp. KTW20L TaxID=2942210 RepID=UPI0020BF22F0|nr:hypothetical protein [Altererythrobacter sp. KTW20L]MCL6249696.1 hypothetical protein [Altererythrobacter sp. KTW20L]